MYIQKDIKQSDKCCKHIQNFKNWHNQAFDIFFNLSFFILNFLRYDSKKFPMFCEYFFKFFLNISSCKELYFGIIVLSGDFQDTSSSKKLMVSLATIKNLKQRIINLLLKLLETILFHSTQTSSTQKTSTQVFVLEYISIWIKVDLFDCITLW